jgi:hypothetical protein
VFGARDVATNRGEEHPGRNGLREHRIASGQQRAIEIVGTDRRGHRDDRCPARLGIRAKKPRDVPAVDTRDDQVEKDGDGVLLDGDAEALGARSRLDDAKPSTLEEKARNVAAIFVIVDDQG